MVLFFCFFLRSQVYSFVMNGKYAVDWIMFRHANSLKEYCHDFGKLKTCKTNLVQTSFKINPAKNIFDFVEQY